MYNLICKYWINVPWKYFPCNCHINQFVIISWVCGRVHCTHSNGISKLRNENLLRQSFWYLHDRMVMLIYFQEYVKMQMSSQKSHRCIIKILMYQTRHLGNINIINQYPTSITKISWHYNDMVIVNIRFSWSIYRYFWYNDFFGTKLISTTLLDILHNVFWYCKQRSWCICY